MQFLSLDQIIISSNRQRREFLPEQLMDLQVSIEQVGLLHPIVVRRTGETNTLVAGERRLRAIQDMAGLGQSFSFENIPVQPGYIPCVELGELSLLEAMEAEYEENSSRTDLTWQEKAQATAQLKLLRDAQSVALGTPPPSNAALGAERYNTANESSSVGIIRRDLILARHLHDPEVAKASGPNEAFKLLIRKEQTRKNEELAEQLGQSFTRSSHKLLNEDSLKWMQLAQPNQFDVILTDPPYGMGADEFGDSGGKMVGAHSYEDSRECLNDILMVFPTESFRITKPEAHLYMFCDLDWFPQLQNEFLTVGWKVFRTPLIWFKPGAYRAPWPLQGPQRKYECCLFAVKGNKHTARLAGDVLEHNPDENLGHMAQKPVALFQDLLSRSIHPGDRVLDPFCGTGPVFPAAHELKCFATGIELRPASYAIAAKRIEELK